MNLPSRTEGQLLEEVRRLREELREARDQAGRSAREAAALRDRLQANQRADAPIGGVKRGLAPEFLEALLNSIPEEIWVADVDKKLTLVNPAVIKEFGYTIGGGMPVEKVAASFEVYRSDGSPRPADEAPPLRALRGEVVRDQEEIVRTPATGELRHRQVNAAPVRDAAGAILGSVSVVRDITERKQAEAALRESEKSLMTHLDAMTRLQRIGTLFVSGDNLEPVFQEIVEAAIAISNADFGNIQLLESKSSSLRIAVQRGFPKWWVEFWDSAFESQGACGTALNRGERVIVEDVEQSPIFIGTPALEVQLKAGVRAVQSTPLVSRSGRLLGMFSTHYRAPGRPDDLALRLLDILARQTADIIERAQNQETLRESEAKAIALVKYAPTGIYELDFRGPKLLSVNEAMCEILGYSREELLAMGPMPLLDPESQRLFAARARRQLAGEQNNDTVEYRIRKKDGSLLDAVLNVTFNIGGDPYRAMVVAHDVTERKAAEEALRKSQEQYRAVVENTTAIILRLDPSGVITFANQRALDFFGYSEDELIGKHAVGTVVPPRETTGRDLAALVDKIAANPDRFHSNANENICKDGRRVWLEWTNSGIYDETAYLMEFLSVGIDATEHKRAEQALRESEGKYRSLFEHMLDGFAYCQMLFDEHGQADDFIYLEVNASFGRLTGLEDVIGKRATQVIPGIKDLNPELFEIYGRVAKTGISEKFEIDFKPLALHLSVSVYGPARGYFVAVFDDITQRKRAEADREALIQRLKSLVQVGADVIAAGSTQELLERVVDAARVLTRANQTISGYGYMDGEFRIGAVSRSPGAQLRPPDSVFSVQEAGLYMDLLDQGLSLRLNAGEFRSHPRWSGLPEGHPPLEGLLGAKLVGPKGGTHGVIMATSKEGGEFTVEDELLLKQLAYLTSVGLQHIEALAALGKARDELEIRVQERTSELRESESRCRFLSSQLLVAQETERKLIAQDVHDSLGSSLAAVKLSLESITKLSGRGAAQKMAESVNDAVASIQRVMDEVRRIQLALHPPFLDDIGIVATLSWLCREFTKGSPRVRVQQEMAADESDIPSTLKTAMYRICQEALHNVAKYSGAALVHLSLRQQDRKIELAVRDNGRGFDPEEVAKREGPSRGLGLASMRERAQLAGGRLTVESASGRGTAIRAAWPLG
ncbi:MAG: PAS domain S-box protein [bacterium]